MKRLPILTVTIISLFAFSACSAIMHSSIQEIELKSNPPSAKITIDGKRFGISPQVVNIERGTDHLLKFQLEGFEIYETQITRKISFWFWG